MGCDWDCYHIRVGDADFNPRTRMGCDSTACVIFDATDISIHAPAWGATDCDAALRQGILFQSTHPHGVRLAQSDFIRQTDYFNPRTRMGCDHCNHPFKFIDTNFNPRTRMGCDHQYQNSKGTNLQFQSTHPHGVRQILASQIRSGRLISIHAPAWGATWYSPRHLHKS